MANLITQYFNQYLLQYLLERCPPNTFIHLISTCKDTYEKYTYLIPVKRKESLRVIDEDQKRYTVLPNCHVTLMAREKGYMRNSIIVAGYQVDALTLMVRKKLYMRMDRYGTTIYITLLVREELLSII